MPSAGCRSAPTRSRRGVNRGSTVVKVSECVKELVAYSRAGYLWRNAVA